MGNIRAAEKFSFILPAPSVDRKREVCLRFYRFEKNSKKFLRTDRPALLTNGEPVARRRHSQENAEAGVFQAVS